MHSAHDSKPIYNLIVQYEQNVVKYARKWRKIWLKPQYKKLLEQMPRRGTNTPGRCHFLMYKNNLSLTMI